MKVFISHSGRDAELAGQISRVLRERGVEVWLDVDQILPGDNWAEAMAQALRESNALLVLLSADSVSNSLVQHEISYALGEEKYKNRVFPVLVDDLALEQIPWILKRMQVVRVRRDDSEDIKQLARMVMDAA